MLSPHFHGSQEIQIGKGTTVLKQIGEKGYLYLQPLNTSVLLDSTIFVIYTHKCCLSGRALNRVINRAGLISIHSAPYSVRRNSCAHFYDRDLAARFMV